MAVKAIEMVRKARDKHYEETKDLLVEEQIKFVRDKAKSLQETLMEKQPSPVTRTLLVPGGWSDHPQRFSGGNLFRNMIAARMPRQSQIKHHPSFPIP